MLRELAIARVCEPMSKLATIGYLKRRFDKDVALHDVYRYMDKLYRTQRDLIQQISVDHTRKILGGRIGIVFYDVTTLYFETSREDGLRAPGFSKDGKTSESQVVLGLLVSRNGYPLSYSLFNGSQFEGRTMLPIDRLEKAYKSGKVSKRNINQRGYNKFLKIENDVAVSIDYGKIGEDAQWDGWKSYVTNTDFPPEEVISLYRELWVVERAFRISKGTLEMRPIFHFTEKRIESHVCICFVAYKLYKELERVIQMMNLGLSVDAVIDIAKTVPTLVLELPDGQMITRTIFNTRDQQLIRPLFPNS